MVLVVPGGVFETSGYLFLVSLYIAPDLLSLFLFS